MTSLFQILLVVVSTSLADTYFMICFRKIFSVTVIFLWIFLPSSEARENIRETPVVKVVRDHASAVVNISTERIVLLQRHPFWNQYGNAFDSLFQEYFSRNMLSAVKTQSIGSGVILRPDGLIVTNAHVVNMASKIFVIFNDRTMSEGKAVLVSPEDDIALVQIKADKPLINIELADSDDIMIGETVVTIGNPFGLENSVSVGVVSGLERYFYLPNTPHVFSGLIQTDASINFGSSGGALLNLEGKLMGINLAVVQNAQSIGFAVSAKKIHQILKVYDQAKQLAAKNPVRVPVT